MMLLRRNISTIAASTLLQNLWRHCQHIENSTKLPCVQFSLLVRWVWSYCLLHSFLFNEYLILNYTLKDTRSEPMCLMESTPHPNIIAIQSPKNANEVKFYIQVKNHLLSVSIHFSASFSIKKWFQTHKNFTDSFLYYSDNFFIKVKSSPIKVCMDMLNSSFIL